MRRVLSCPAFVQPGSTASARQAVVAHSMPDLLAAAIFVPPQRLLDCVLHGPAGSSEILSRSPFSQRGMTVPVSASAPDLAVCLATPDPMASREEAEEDGDEDDDELSRRLARTLEEERAEASRRRQRRLLFAKLRGGAPRRRLPRGG